MKRWDDEVKTVIKRMIENEELTVSFDNRCVQRSEINLVDIR